MQNKTQSWWDRLFAPNRSPYAGQQIIGRNIWGETGAVDTHYPVTKPFSAPHDAAWVDRNGDIASIIVRGRFGELERSLDHNNWNNVLNKAKSKEELDYIEQKLKDKGFFHVSELPPNMRSKVPIDIQADTPMMQAPPMVDEDEQLPYDSREGEPILLPPHIYYYELVPDENYSLDYDNGKHYLPPYDPNAPKVEGKFTPKDYAGEMPPVGDKGGGEEFDDYMSYAPPVGQVPPVGEAPSTKDIRRNPMLFQKATPELIPDIPYWLDYTGKKYSPTAQRNILNDLLALGRTTDTFLFEG